MTGKGSKSRVTKHSGKSSFSANQFFDLQYKGSAQTFVLTHGVYEGGNYPLLSSLSTVDPFVSLDQDLGDVGAKLGPGGKVDDLGDLTSWPKLCEKDGENVDNVLISLEQVKEESPSTSRLLVAANVEEEDWVCLSPKLLYRDAVKNAGECGSVASRTSSVWMLIDEDDESESDDRMDGLQCSFVEEEILIGEDVHLEEEKPDMPQEPGNGNLFFGDY